MIVIRKILVISPKIFSQKATQKYGFNRSIDEWIIYVVQIKTVNVYVYFTLKL